MPENDTRVWLDVPAAELCFNHVGSIVRATRGSSSVEGKLVALAMFHHDDHSHLKAVVEIDDETVVEIDDETVAEVQPDVADTIQISVGEDK